MTRTMATLEQRLELTEKRMSSLIYASSGQAMIAPDGLGTLFTTVPTDLEVEEYDAEETQEQSGERTQKLSSFCKKKVYVILYRRVLSKKNYL